MPIKRPRPIFRTGILRGRLRKPSGSRFPLDLPVPSSIGVRRRRPFNRMPLGQLVLVALILLAVTGGLTFWRGTDRAAPPLASTPEIASHPAPVPAQGPARTANLGQLSALPGQAIVVDGDTLRLQNAVVRLDGVEAPARGEACEGPAGTDCAAAAAAQLAILVRERAVSCRVVGHDALGRATARCDLGGAGEGETLNQKIVASGWARARAGNLQAAETMARASHRGLWTTTIRTGSP